MIALMMKDNGWLERHFTGHSASFRQQSENLHRASKSLRLITEFECPPCEEEWLTTQQFCERFRISESNLRTTRRRGDVEFKYFGRSYRYRV